MYTRERTASPARSAKRDRCSIERKMLVGQPLYEQTGYNLRKPEMLIDTYRFQTLQVQKDSVVSAQVV